MEHYLKKELFELIQTDTSIFEFIESNTLDGMWYWDLEKPENEWMSEKFWTELGYDPKEMPHSPAAWQDIINQEDLALAREKINEHIASPNSCYNQIVRYKHKDGSTVWIRCRGKIIRNEQGNPIRMLGAHNNITDFEKEKEKIATLNRQLIQKNKALEQFSYITSHDLQEPLNTIISYSSLLSDTYKDQFDGVALKSLEIIEETSLRMKELIKSILDYSRIGGGELRLVSIDLNQLLNNITTDLQNKINSTNALIQFDNLPIVNGYKVELRLLFQNLISNAIKYRKDDTAPIVQIMSTEDQDYWYFSIIDNGIGIAPKHFDKIFEIFQRLHTKEQYNGLGIGLAHCKKITQLHSGTIFLTSKEGEGSTFTFSISKNL